MTEIRKTPATVFTDFLPLNPFKSLPEPFQSSSFYYTMNGRNAIFQALKHASIDKKSTVLLPAYHCTALVDPFISYGVNVAFYNVNRDMSVNIDEIESLITNDISALLYVHFFGFPAPVKQFEKIAEKYKIFIIEDCTHTLYGKIGDQYLGTFGDASIFSFRKTLSVKDGAALILKSKNSRIKIQSTPLIYNLKIAKWSVENPNWDDKNSQEKSCEKKVKKVKLQREIGFSKKGPDSQEDPQFLLEYANWSGSIFSKWIFRQTNSKKILKKRRENYNYLDSKLRRLKNIKPCFDDLPTDFCPLGYPFLFESENRLDYKLRSKGIPAFSFGEELHERLDTQSFPDADYLSKNMVLIPVHHQLKITQLDFICSTIEESINNLN